jgi:hypothetical protein
MEAGETLVIAIRGFKPPEELKNASAHPFLTLQIGDIVKVANKINTDWAFGRLITSTDSALFPLNYTRPLKITECVSIRN